MLGDRHDGLKRVGVKARLRNGGRNPLSCSEAPLHAAADAKMRHLTGGEGLRPTLSEPNPANLSRWDPLEGGGVNGVKSQRT